MVAEVGGTALSDADYDQQLKGQLRQLSAQTQTELTMEQAKAIGIDGLVCSAEEAANLRTIAGSQMSLVTPGIRPAGSAAGDQKRIMTPSRAIAAGADYLVVGRPVMEAADPKAAADAIVSEIQQARN